MNKLFTQLVEKRHLTEDYLHPKYDQLEDPATLPDMAKAVARIKQAIANNERILIYGDYDVDGVTASTVMEQALKLAKIPPSSITIMLPDRFIDGYGMSPRLVTRAKETGSTLVITVDCGSRNHAIVDELNHEHIDTIVTDHHECEPTLPSATAVINPKRHDYQGPATLRDLAGVGVAFKLAQALVQQKLIPDGQEKWLLDLVLLGTICDSMTLTKENRILTYYGLKVLEKTRRPGLKAILQNAKAKTINSETIGFQIGPRLNAAGRLTTAELALSVLRTPSGAEATKLASELETLNKQRRHEQIAALDEITTRGLVEGPVIIETGPWHEGILGIIAGRLVEQYKRPAFVLAEIENNIYKGSGRSFGDFNLAEALTQVKDVILGGGGHAAAAGVKLDGKNLYQFRERINAYYDSLHLTDQTKHLRLAPDLTVTTLADFNFELLDDLKSLEPFGPGNEEPLFCLKDVEVISTRRLGADGKHLRLDFHEGATILKSVAFGVPADWFTLADLAVARDPAAPTAYLVRPVLNEFQGTTSVEVRLLDILV
ncbi:single-stranded-DNA-specific exonuclease RecJ [Candidatus Saccharibacteria bacterium]|nr:single-stranded-DNA-specific exonuclease RecJ [Candidatus Saccharibacteria bacterium]